MERICARGPLLVQFVDVAHFSSVRTLPYLQAWAERYEDLGLSIIGVNSPRFPFTGDARKLAAAVERLGIRFPVAVDDGYRAWHAYGCEGWPSLFLWGTGGPLRWFHFGEGEYAGTEEAIQEELRRRDAGVELPDPMEPLRATDGPGTLVATPSEEVFPGGSASEPWRVADGDPPLELEYSAGEAWASVDGRGVIEVSLDDGPPARIEVDAPGAFRLASHDRHSSHRLSVGPSGGLSVYSVGFAAGVPEP